MFEFLRILRGTLFGSCNGDRDGTSFDPARDIHSLAGKVILITGAAGGLGLQTAVELARYGRPAGIYIADLPLAETAKTALIDRVLHDAYGDEDNDPATRTVIRFLDLDLTSFASVRACAAEFISKEERLDTLILNAGVMRVLPLLTSEGYEFHFGLNYLGHALLTRLLLPNLRRTAQSSEDVRIVVVSSEGHAYAPKEGIQYGGLKTSCHQMSYAQRYGQSKVALNRLMRELARRYPDIKTVAIHPGRILTGIAASVQKESKLARLAAPIAPLVCVPVTVGIRNHLWAATSPEVVSGIYYEPVGVAAKTSKVAGDEALTEKLWEWTSNELEGLDVLN